MDGDVPEAKDSVQQQQQAHCRAAARNRVRRCAVGAIWRGGRKRRRGRLCCEAGAGVLVRWGQAAGGATTSKRRAEAAAMAERGGRALYLGRRRATGGGESGGRRSSRRGSRCFACRCFDSPSRAFVGRRCQSPNRHASAAATPRPLRLGRACPLPHHPIPRRQPRRAHTNTGMPTVRALSSLYSARPLVLSRALRTMAPTPSLKHAEDFLAFVNASPTRV